MAPRNLCDRRGRRPGRPAPGYFQENRDRHRPVLDRRRLCAERPAVRQRPPAGRHGVPRPDRLAERRRQQLHRRGGRAQLRRRHTRARGRRRGRDRTGLWRLV